MNMPIPNYYPAYTPSPQLYEQEQIRFVSQRLGFTLLIMQGFSAVLQVIVAVMMIVLQGTSLAALKDALTSPAALWIINVAVTVPMFTIPFILGAKMLRQPVGSLLPLRRVRVSLTAALCGVSLGVAMVGNFMTNIFAELTESMGIDSGMPDLDYPEGIAGKILSLLAISAVPALIEEFAFRGVFMGALRRFGDLFAIFMSAAFFGLMHGNLVQIPFAFIVGLALGLTVKISGSLWPAIIAHFLNNFFSVLLDMASAQMEGPLFEILSGVYCLLALAAALAGGIWLKKRGKLALSDESYTQKLHTKDKVQAFFRAPALTVAAALMLGGMVLNIAAVSLLRAMGLQ